MELHNGNILTILFSIDIHIGDKYTYPSRPKWVASNLSEDLVPRFIFERHFASNEVNAPTTKNQKGMMSLGIAENLQN